MPSLKEVKSRITSVISTQQITKAMKMVAAAKLRKSQDRIMQFRPFAQHLSYLLKNLSSSSSEGIDWYNAVRPVNRVLIVAISSDRGLCGGFNSSVIKITNRLMQEEFREQARAGNVSILPIGKKTYEYYTKRNIKVVDAHWNIFGSLNFERVGEVAEFMMEAFRKSEYDRIVIVYNEFKNVATQILRTEQFLPIELPKDSRKGQEIDYIFEPNREEIIAGLIPKSLKVQLFKSVIDSNAAENGARMTAMDKATENAGELLKDLKLTYNRTRQAAITKEILEIVAGAEALKSS
jgi:F-type H+-transporting ATPase subunit gamma